MQPENFVPLDNIRVARPCRADWDAMEGGEHVRHCLTCHKNVYNLSALTREQAQALIQEHEGRLCVRFYRRADGTLMSGDCPVGTAAARRPLAWVAGCAALLCLSAGAAFRPASQGPLQCEPAAGAAPLVDRMREWPVVGGLVNRVAPPPVVVMGMMSVAPPPGSGGAPAAGGE